jgi:hypothetical protein
MSTLHRNVPQLGWGALLTWYYRGLFLYHSEYGEAHREKEENDHGKSGEGFIGKKPHKDK